MANWRIGALKEILALNRLRSHIQNHFTESLARMWLAQGLAVHTWGLQIGKLRSGTDGPAQLVTDMLSGSTCGFPGGRRP